MESQLLKDNTELQNAFGIIVSIDTFRDYIVDIAELIYNGELTKETLAIVLEEHEIVNILEIKEELLDLLIVYINLILNDHVITANEIRTIKILKTYFKIKEGDLNKYRPDSVEDTLSIEFERLYADNKINPDEALFSVDLQDLFDLSFDQFDAYKAKEVRAAMERGANITDFDIVKYPKVSVFNTEVAGRSISQEVMNNVWNRDGGKCVICGSSERLEYDHIIPFSKGGSNTFRNIQLLCESCNRKKKNNIG